MGLMIIVWILAILFVIACTIGVVALYLTLKGWAWDQMDIELPPKAKQQESYWEINTNNVTPSYICMECNYESDRKYKHCPWCGMKTKNYDMKKK